jgi:hypothetical protein
MSCRGRAKPGNHPKSNAVLEIGFALDRRERSLFGETVDICSEIHTEHNECIEQVVDLL